ncbi:MAG: NAD(P)H-dependent oxidoreductase [Candidatus Omnitrophica bacterium]|nr:NAD(P)H-dependent oxidoreductase [Candidatus Omnitrophota bacterium]
MKTAVVYYSFTGNTHRVAQIIVDILKNKGEDVVPVRIRPLKEETSFFMQCKDAFLAKKPELYKTLLDLKDFDKVILGSPVWAFKPAPAINTYLDKCVLGEGKKAILFVTYGSGTGKKKALEVMKKGIEKKGASVIKALSFQQAEKEKSCREKIEKVL